jgi:hypothetical protein
MDGIKVAGNFRVRFIGERRVEHSGALSCRESITIVG